ncbi:MULTISPECIES: GerW family sporulation protein [Flagellimonas]|uniref:Sporulation protein n=2 Tax=Flagellimonas TaxID=444459 RepID=A0A3A1ND36_9FLAO|nr:MULTISPECIES: spore germination protein GerW family protein [Allomuricauda]RIV41962.1 sporulation protein [Allomuricauda maritima]RIV68562.1 sporulation protein [Allomuricauda aequoris]TXJ90840.1 sporulation protein [Allomuricauda maritima]TXK00259.1 sporulation protein [Allomuricauda aequoris]
MDLHFEELLSKVTDFIKSEAKTETIIGEPFELGEFKCVPVIKVGMGFGSGGGEGIEGKERKGEGAGAGAGIGIQPIGFLVTKGDEISFLEAGKTHGLAAAFEKVPDLIERIVKERNKKEEVVA